MSITGRFGFVKCRNCGLVSDIDDLAVFVERHGFSEPPFEQFRVCPSCKSTSLDDEVNEDGRSA